LFVGNDGTTRVVLTDGEEGIATGQACVFYDNGSGTSKVLGGGIIAKTLKTAPGSKVPSALDAVATGQ
jgi:tRNA-specific 2-thiouridylase